MSAVRIELARATDLPTILSVETACFAQPWPAESWQQELARPWADVWLARDGDDVLGLACAWTVADESHLLRVAVRPEHRRRGLARDLLGAVIAAARAAECTAVVLEVGAANVAARRLYERAMFEAIGTRERYYADPVDDAIVMRLRLSPT